MKKLAVILVILAVTLLMALADEQQIIDKANQYLKVKNYQAAFQTIEDGINEIGETHRLLAWKYNFLFKSKQYDQALQTALRKEEIAEKKSPWDCVDIFVCYLKKEDYQKALDWLNRAADRGFIRYNSPALRGFQAVADRPRYQNIIKKIKDRIGLGQPAKDFTVELLSGKKFILSQQKGKVVLIDFWASWCPPCRAEMPNLKKYYAEFKDKGLEIIGISLDFKKEKLEDYLSQEDLRWKVSFSGQGWKDETARLYGVHSIPATWLVDKKGVLREFGLRGERLRQAIANLLAEKN